MPRCPAALPNFAQKMCPNCDVQQKLLDITRFQALIISLPIPMEALCVSILLESQWSGLERWGNYVKLTSSIQCHVLLPLLILRLPRNCQVSKLCFPSERVVVGPLVMFSCFRYKCEQVSRFRGVWKERWMLLSWQESHSSHMKVVNIFIPIIHIHTPPINNPLK